MSVSELIEELKKFPPDMPVIGFRHGNYSDDPRVYPIKAVFGDWRVRYYDDMADERVEATDCVMIEF
jgi:hypothetical protein